jgi:HEAT repeat protein
MRRALAAVVLLLAGSASAAPTSLTDLVAALGDKDYGARQQARTELMSRKDPAVIRLLAAAMPSMDYSARIYAQSVLDVLPPEKTRGLWLSFLKANDADLRALAAVSLYRRGDFVGIPVVARDLRNADLDPGQATHALMRIYTVRHPILRAAVIERLGRNATVAVWRALLRHVYYVRDAAYVPPLRSIATHPTMEVRVRVRAILYVLGATDVVADLAGEIAGRKVAYSVLLDVLTWLEQGPEPPAALRDAVLRHLEDEEHALTIARLLGTLASWRHHGALPLAEKLLDHDDPKVVKAAFALIAEIAGKGQIPSLRRGTESPVHAVRVLAAEALRRFDDESGLPAVLEVLRTGDAVDRREAARVLGGYRRRDVVPPLLLAFDDEDVSVRTYAYSGLAQVITALFPYRRFDWSRYSTMARAAPTVRRQRIAELRAWWERVSTE